MLTPGHTPVCRRSHVSAAQPPISVSRRLVSCGTREVAVEPCRHPDPVQEVETHGEPDIEPGQSPPQRQWHRGNEEASATQRSRARSGSAREAVCRRGWAARGPRGGRRRVDVDMTDTVSSVSDHSTTPQAIRAHGPGSGGRSNVSVDQSPQLLRDTPDWIAHTCVGRDAADSVRSPPLTVSTADRDSAWRCPQVALRPRRPCHGGGRSGGCCAPSACLRSDRCSEPPSRTRSGSAGGASRTPRHPRGVRTGQGHDLLRR
jgi:hypothetical protein